MTSTIQAQLDDILSSDAQNVDEKVKMLIKLQNDARDLQRAATEGGMDHDDGQNNDLRQIELALEKLGFDVDGNGAATL